jgi:hypothetical protein
VENHKQKNKREKRRQSKDNVPPSIETEFYNGLWISKPIYQKSDPENAVSTETILGDEWLPQLTQIPSTELGDR